MPGLREDSRTTQHCARGVDPQQEHYDSRNKNRSRRRESRLKRAEEPSRPVPKCRSKVSCPKYSWKEQGIMSGVP